MRILRIVFLPLLIFIFSLPSTSAQECYWIFFRDKNNTSFDPATYFHPNAIERRLQQGLPLCDSTDFPLNAQYKSQTAALSEEVMGESRWFNALAVKTFQIEDILALPFVKNVQRIDGDFLPATVETDIAEDNTSTPTQLTEQLYLMKGEAFTEQGIDGKGLRIAVLDGGFKMADTHPAFQHLRDEHRIVATYNFPLKKENVYGWDSHGTMVLSCIAGIDEHGRPLGLATGAEFLLARTETGLENRIEEVWWQMGMEWADRNGANIINSSLGYGKDRYNPDEMDGTSLVAKAAQMAAAKGILVCNSMGNEGDDRTWRTIITPADAEGVLAVGGIDRDGNPSSFTSLGPTSDGRLKPNVSAMASRVDVANPSRSQLYTKASGTSFASPLTAGFAACAWQTHREWNCQQLLAEIEKSGSLYPYYDYQYGYGVPQADYFTHTSPIPKSPTVKLYQTDSAIFIVVPDECIRVKNLLYHIAQTDGRLVEYRTVLIKERENIVKVQKSSYRNIDGWVLRAHYDGYTIEYHSDKDHLEPFPKEQYNQRIYWRSTEIHTADIDRPRVRGVNARYNFAPYLSLGFPIPFSNGIYMDDPGDAIVKGGQSVNFLVGLRYKHNFCKWYSLGGNLELGGTWYRLKYPAFHSKVIHTEQLWPFYELSMGHLTAEIYQRFRLAAGGLFGYGVFFDTGIYGRWNFGCRQTIGDKGIRVREHDDQHVVNRLEWGVRARIGFDLVSVYVQYRISRLIAPPVESIDCPHLEVGAQLTLPFGK
ncbi:MAG: S8 family serine peptidase [Bacteroidales bacterium]|nr:S8 family serine peptidase [Bacteroidales bacterium]